jgi:hypothetical protein
MKFARFLEVEAIPEWRPKFIKYKLLKDKLQELSTAVQAKTDYTSEELAEQDFQTKLPSLPCAPDTIQLKRASLFVTHDCEGGRAARLRPRRRRDVNHPFGFSSDRSA